MSHYKGVFTLDEDVMEVEFDSFATEMNDLKIDALKVLNEEFLSEYAVTVAIAQLAEFTCEKIQ